MISINDVERPLKATFRKDLLGLDKNGRRCECCDKHMHDHFWAILDDHGFVLYCDNQLTKDAYDKIDQSTDNTQNGH